MRELGLRRSYGAMVACLGGVVLCFILLMDMAVPVSSVAMQPPADFVNLSPVADSDVYAYSYRNWNNSNVGRNHTLTAGYHPTGGERRIYMRFDLDGIRSVEAATLRLHHYHTGGTNNLALGVYMVTSPWEEGMGTYHSGQVEPNAAPGELCWNNQPHVDPEPLVEFRLPSAPNSTVSIDMTPLVAAWAAGAPNYGFVIQPVGTLSPQVGESQYGFLSREYENADQHPVLSITTSSGTGTGNGVSLPPEADVDVYAYTYRNWNNANWGKWTTISAGYHPTGGERRAYLYFDVTNVGQVDSAVLRLYHYHTGGSNHLRMGLFFVTEPWHEGSGTYHSGQVEPTAAPTEIRWTDQPQIRPEASVIFNLPAAPGSFIELDMTEMVRRWKEGAPNYGFVIKPVDALSPQVGESMFGFVAREHENAEQRPLLIINGGSQVVIDTDKPVLSNSIKLFDAVSKQSSDVFRPNTYPQVSMTTTRWDKTPYHLQTQYTGSLNLAPGQHVYLASDPEGTAPITVDNFLLFELRYAGFVNMFVIGDNEPVSYEGTPAPQVLPVSFSFSQEVDLGGLFPKGIPIELTVSALDYGGVGVLTDVYLILK